MELEQKQAKRQKLQSDANSSGSPTIYATGFNAHGQLQPEQDGDVRVFRPMTVQASRINILFAGWSTTVLQTGDKIIGRGSHAFTQTDAVGEEVVLKSGFGDHNGMIGCLDNAGGLLLLSQNEGQEYHLEYASKGESPLLSNITLAGNDRLSVTFKQAPNGNLCHIAEFANVDKFLAWYHDPSGDGNYPMNHHMLAGRPKQLLANTATFVLLMEGGEVYTWGDPRHQTLGRAINGDGATPADKPGLLDALAGLKLDKVSTGGWMSAARSKDGAAYLWGARNPGAEHGIKAMRDAEVGEVVLVDISLEDQEPLDILDVAVGNGHVAVLAEGNRIFVVGDNTNGQLGIDSQDPFMEDWNEFSRLPKAKEVVCGPKSTFVIVEKLKS